MPKIPKGKKMLLAYIPEDLFFRLYEHVKAKYMGFHGGLSVEVQNAIAHWLNEQGLAAHTQTHINPGMPRALSKLDAIIKRLKDGGYTDQFSVKDWEEACTHEVGGDPRTIKKYLKLAEKLHRIKFNTGSVWEII